MIYQCAFFYFVDVVERKILKILFKENDVVQRKINKWLLNNKHKNYSFRVNVNVSVVFMNY